jgi:peptidase E
MPSHVQVSISNIEKGSSIEEIAREFYKELKLFNSI